MSGINRLTSTPWHIERYTREEGDSRRHRSRCIYFTREKNYCSREIGRCRGSAHCLYYSETEKHDSATLQESTIGGPSRTNDIDDKTNEFAMGRMVKHKVFGMGEITDRQGKIVVINFSDGQTRRLILEDCINQRLLAIISTEE